MSFFGALIGGFLGARVGKIFSENSCSYKRTINNYSTRPYKNPKLPLKEKLAENFYNELYAIHEKINKDIPYCRKVVDIGGLGDYEYIFEKDNVKIHICKSQYVDGWSITSMVPKGTIKYFIEVKVAGLIITDLNQIERVLESFICTIKKEVNL